MINRKTICRKSYVAIDGKDFAVLVSNMDKLKCCSRRITEKYFVNVNNNNFSWNTTIDVMYVPTTVA